MANGVLPATLGVRIARCLLSNHLLELHDIGALVNDVRERFSNLTQPCISYCRSIPRQEPFQIAKPFTEFWAKGTSASKIGNRFLTLILQENQAKSYIDSLLLKNIRYKLCPQKANSPS